MKTIAFHFDPISPYAHLAFHRLPQVLEGCSYVVDYQPLLLAGLLKAHGNKGPAEIEPKRQWTFRYVHWLAQQHGIELATPTQHPFNPLPLLRLLLAAGPNRRTVQAVLQHVWVGGHDANDPMRLAELREQLAPTRDPDGDEVKAELRARTEAAVASGVFGVPTCTLDGRHFWGLDALPMLRDALQGAAWFQGPDWEAAAAPRAGIVRR
ncbi:MAG: DsbA family protein [Rubrivivax sp.]|nr:DsbA family protein [Rubrivivax sp.]